jgi:hypothetical protein
MLQRRQSRSLSSMLVTAAGPSALAHSQNAVCFDPTCPRSTPHSTQQARRVCLEPRSSIPNAAQQLPPCVSDTSHIVKQQRLERVVQQRIDGEVACCCVGSAGGRPGRLLQLLLRHMRYHAAAPAASRLQVTTCLASDRADTMSAITDVTNG